MADKTPKPNPKATPHSSKASGLMAGLRSSQKTMLLLNSAEAAKKGGAKPS